MKKIIFILLIVMLSTEVSFAYDIKNAKKGSTIIIDWDASIDIGVTEIGDGWSYEGHAGIVIDTYKNDDDRGFIVGAHGDGVVKESYAQHLGHWNHLGHFRATSKNYTDIERRNIVKAAKSAVGKAYEKFNLYVYGTVENYFNDNIPLNISTIPSDFRCDGLAEWSTEVGLNTTNPKESDGFYESNTLWQQPKYIAEDAISGTKGSVDKIGTPDKPILSLGDNSVLIEFSKVSGAWSEALYAVYRLESFSEFSLSDVFTNIFSPPIYCDKVSNFISTNFIDTNIQEDTKYYYSILVGERTASCSDLSLGNMDNWSNISETSIIKTPLDTTSCTANITSSTSCTVSNGIGTKSKTCSADGSNWSNYSSCSVSSCNSDYIQSGNSCIAEVVTPPNSTSCTPNTTSITSCIISNGIGEKSKTCSATGEIWSSYSSCSVTSCNSGYVQSGNSCIVEPTVVLPPTQNIDPAYFFMVTQGFAVNAYQPASQSNVNVYLYSQADEDQYWVMFGTNNIQRYGTDLCLNAYSPTQGSDINLYPCNKYDSEQQWEAISNSTESTLIRLKGTSYCLNAHTPSNSSNLNLYTCDFNDPEQNFNRSLIEGFLPIQ